MSYPAPRYHGDDGEVSATFRAVDTPPTLERGGRGEAETWSRMHYLATGTDIGDPDAAVTDGDYGLYRVELGPRAGGPGPHFHRTMSEAFFVLGGTVRIFDGEQWRDATAGDFVHVPPGGLHGFGNESDEPASMLLLFAPGAPREDYFERVGDTGSMTTEERAAFYLHHDNHWRTPGT